MTKAVSENKILKGKRKTAISRVKLLKGKSKIEVNKKNLEDYFISEIQQITIKEPLVLTKMLDQYKVKIYVKGGGLSAQAGAAKLAIARALIQEDKDLRSILKKAGLLTCDARQKERKKYGRKKARKQFQFSKR